MSDSKLPILRKAKVDDLVVHVARSGLAIGDVARIARMSDGRLGVFAVVQKLFLGLFPRRSEALLGFLGPTEEDILAPLVDHGDALRVRIVTLMPEYLAHGQDPEIHVSVWGGPRHLRPAHDLSGQHNGPGGTHDRLSRLEMI